jgi:23S rRNA (cytosine1962-C5)-methyltransferase
MKAIHLKPGREKSVLRKHPWIFSGAIASVEGRPKPGETVDILDASGARLGRGAYSPESQITVRAWTFDPEEEISPEFFRGRFERALGSRGLTAGEKGRALERSRSVEWSRGGEATWAVEETRAAGRLVNAESDGLPGIIVDRYSEFLVVQLLTAGAEYWKGAIIDQLSRLIPATGVYERSDVDVREKEGLPLFAGTLSGQEPPDLVEIGEGPCRFLVDIKHGHKTGFYLDQRDNRAIFAGYARGAEILNCFSYTGGFGIAALKAGAAKVTNVDSSATALELARRNVELNGLDASSVEYAEGDAFTILRRYRGEGRRFDLVVLDPPKFAESQSQLMRASRGYKDINLLAFKLMKPGGMLFTFSCSGLVSPELFQKIVADAALDAGRDAQIVRRLAQASDHPIALGFPEGGYLKGLVCRVPR